MFANTNSVSENSIQVLSVAELAGGRNLHTTSSGWRPGGWPGHLLSARTVCGGQTCAVCLAGARGAGSMAAGAELGPAVSSALAPPGGGYSRVPSALWQTAQ